MTKVLALPKESTLLSMCFFSLIIGGCGADARNPSTSDVVNPEVSSKNSLQEEKVLNLATWSDYIAPETIPTFEHETGIKVRLETYDNNEMLESKLSAGHTGWDVVVPTVSFFEHQRKAGFYRPLNKAALTNLKNADPQILRLMAADDPDNLYAVPYMYAVTGIAYNVAQVRKRLGSTAAVDSWAILFDPATAAKLQDCGIAIIDSPGDVFLPMMMYLGLDPKKTDPADLIPASKALQKIRPFVRYIDPSQHTSDLASGSICIALAWAGDLAQAQSRAREAKTGVELQFHVPREGGLIIPDMMAVPADAPHPHNADLWLNYLLRAEVIAQVTNAIHYPNGNLASRPLLDPAILNDSTIYPDDETMKRLITIRNPPVEYSRILTREWTRFKTGN